MTMTEGEMEDVSPLCEHVVSDGKCRRPSLPKEAGFLEIRYLWESG